MTAHDTLLLDLDGTLTDNYAGISRSILHALEKLGADAAPEAELRRCVGPPLRHSFARLLGSDDPAMVERALVLYRERYTVTGWCENAVYAGVADALAVLRRRGHRLMLCTSKPKVYAERIVTHFGLAQYLDAVYGAELGGRLDDKARLMASLLSGERLAPDCCVMIGDRAQDMHAAHAHGVAAIGVLWGYGSRGELVDAGAHMLLDAPAQLPGAVQPPAAPA